MKKALIVCNPNSGKGLSVDILIKYYEKLNNAGYDVDLSLTKRPHHATEIVEGSADYDLLLSIGGDGTLNEVVNGNFNREKMIPVVPLPTGSCNDVASMLGYNKSPLKNIDMAISGNIKEMDIGLINGKCFTYVVGMGKFMHIPYETSRDKKSKIGYLAYIKEGIKEFFNDTKRYEASVLVDGVEMIDKYSLIIISNSNHIAGVPRFYKNISLDDQKFEVLLCKSKSKENLVASFIGFYLGLKPKNMVSLSASNIKIKLSELPEKNWCIDGEKLSINTTEYNISTHNKMNFVVPQGKSKKLFKEIK